MQQQLRSFSYRIPIVTRPAQSGLDRCADRSRFNCYKPRERLRLYADGVGNSPPEGPEKPPDCGPSGVVELSGASSASPPLAQAPALRISGRRHCG